MLSANDAIRLQEEKQMKEDSEDKVLTWYLKSVESRIRKAIETKKNKTTFTFVFYETNSLIEKVVRNLETLGYKVEGRENKDCDWVLDISW